MQPNVQMLSAFKTQNCVVVVKTVSSVVMT